MKKKDIAIDYRSLLMSTLKERSLALAIGLGTVAIIASIAFWLAFSKISYITPPIQKVKKAEVKEKPAEKKIQTYVVKEGDQLFLIAEKLTGSGQNMQAIMETNNITNPDLLEVGQKLIIPDTKTRNPN